MRTRSNVIFALFVFFIYVASVNAQTDTTTIVVEDTKGLLEAQNLLQKEASTTPTRTILQIKAKTYVLHDTFRIDQSNVCINANPGTKLILADHVNKPVIAIGSQEEIPSYTIENICISGVEIDGNKDNQDSEFDADKPWIRNNGIDVRAVNRLTIDNVVSGNNRSGGLVVSWGSSNIHVLNSEFDNNYFDGVAYYDSTRIYTQNSSMKDNSGAGISLDNNLSDSIFSNCIADSNQDVGLFVRFATQLRFNNCVIKNSLNWAAYLGQDENGNGVHDIMFSGCQLLNNHGGIFLSSTNDTQSNYTSVVGSVFRGNEQDGRLNIQTSGSTVWESANIEMQ
jgi:hypothetical protein